MKYSKIAPVALLVALALPALAADNRKEFKYTVAPGASVTLINEFGPVNIKSAPGRQLLIVATSHSDKVEVDSSQTGNRIEARTHFLQKTGDQEGRVDYDVSVPARVTIVVRGGTGPIQAEKLQADVTLKGDAANVSVRDVNNAHVHVQTVAGSIELTNINGGHVEIISADGPVHLSSVTGPKVSVSTTSGDISYDGDFGSGGEYSLSNHSGNIDVTLPETASIDLMARSITGSVQNDLPLQRKPHMAYNIVDGRSSVGTSNSGASSVQLRSFSGKIRVKKR